MSDGVNVFMFCLAMCAAWFGGMLLENVLTQRFLKVRSWPRCIPIVLLAAFTCIMCGLELFGVIK